MSDSASSAPNPQKFAKPSYLPLLLAALFMTVGITALVYLGREETRLRGTPIGELDLQPLLFTEKEIEPTETKGKVMVLHFWGFWCGPCLMEYPSLPSCKRNISTRPTFCSQASRAGIAPLKQKTTWPFTRRNIWIVKKSKICRSTGTRSSFPGSKSASCSNPGDSATPLPSWWISKEKLPTFGEEPSAAIR